jgi:adenine-specific DNA-methyltransferase
VSHLKTAFSEVCSRQRSLLSRCEWGHDDYSLSVENLPKAPPKLGQQELFGEELSEG